MAQEGLWRGEREGIENTVENLVYGTLATVVLFAGFILQTATAEAPAVIDQLGFSGLWTLGAIIIGLVGGLFGALVKWQDWRKGNRTWEHTAYDRVKAENKELIEAGKRIRADADRWIIARGILLESTEGHAFVVRVEALYDAVQPD